MIYCTLNKDMFSGLEPKAVYNEYKIYDIVEQRGLACAEAIEFLAGDTEYDYYFNCLKSDRIYLVSDTEVIKVKDAYKRGIISKETLYELKIVDRMEAHDLFLGLEPKAVYKEYKVYDLIEQRGTMCAQALEIVYTDETYEYYFNCLKSGSVYFVSDIETIDFHEAKRRNILNYEELYELNIIDRMEKTYE
jgi:hypothetical protein